MNQPDMNLPPEHEPLDTTGPFAEPQAPLSQESIPLTRPIQENFYDALGGEAAFYSIVREFYSRVQRDELLWPMYPAHDLEGAIDRLAKFFIQYWGGPTHYSQERGHPRLRMRHNAFQVTPTARDHWLEHMTAAIELQKLAPLYEATFLDYIGRAARMLVNSAEAPTTETSS
ncbi:MAG: globin [Microbacteriaceae bacterium]